MVRKLPRRRGRGVLDPKWIWVCPSDVAMVVGPPLWVQIFFKVTLMPGPLWVQICEKGTFKSCLQFEFLVLTLVEIVEIPPLWVQKSAKPYPYLCFQGRL